MLKVWSWGEAQDGRIEVAATLEVACYQAHQEVGVRRGSFELLQVEASELADVWWRERRGKHRFVYLHGTLRDGLQFAEGPIWLSVEAIYRLESTAKATRSRGTRTAYFLEVDGKCGLVCVNPRLHAVEIRLHTA